MHIPTPLSSLGVRAKRAIFESSAGQQPRYTASNISVLPPRRSADTNAPRRNPLSFLSPNKSKARSHRSEAKSFAEVLCSTSNTNDTKKEATCDKINTEETNATRLRLEIDGLRSRLVALDCETRRGAVIGRSEGKEGDKNEKLELLNEKLHQIQLGLAEIEQERCVLLTRARTLEFEKDEIQTQLALREREIKALSRRCTLQAEKIAEASKGFVATSTDSQTTSEVEEISQQCKDLTNELRTLREERDIVEKALHECRLQMQRLTNEKRDCQRDYNMMMAEAKRDLQKVTAGHSASIFELKRHLDSSNMKISQLELQIVEKNRTIQCLREESAENRCIREEVAKSLSDKYEAAIESLSSKHFQELQDQQRSHQLQIEFLSSKVKEKEDMVALLKGELSRQMEELMNCSTHLHEVREMAHLLEVLPEQIICMERERDELLTSLQASKCEIAEVSAALLKQFLDRSMMEANLCFQLDAMEREMEAMKAIMMSEREEIEDRMQFLEVCAQESFNSVVVETPLSNGSTDDIDASLCEKDDLITFLQTNLERLQREKEQSSEAHQTQVLKLHRLAQRVSMELAIKDDEIRDLRMIDLAEKSDTIRSLESEVTRLSRLLKEKEEDASTGREALIVRDQNPRVKDHTNNSQKRSNCEPEGEQINVCQLRKRFADLLQERKFDRERKLVDINADVPSTSEKILDLESDVTTEGHLHSKSVCVRKSLPSGEHTFESAAARKEAACGNHSVENLPFVETDHILSEQLLAAETEGRQLQQLLDDKTAEVVSLREEARSKETQTAKELDEERNRRQRAEKALLETQEKLNSLLLSKSNDMAGLLQENRKLRDIINHQTRIVPSYVSKGKENEPVHMTAPTPSGKAAPSFNFISP